MPDKNLSFPKAGRWCLLSLLRKEITMFTCNAELMDFFVK